MSLPRFSPLKIILTSLAMLPQRLLHPAHFLCHKVMSLSSSRVPLPEEGEFSEDRESILLKFTRVKTLHGACIKELVKHILNE